jgi:hypothetical protein
VLEFLPRFLEDDREPDVMMIREQFEQYRSEYPAASYDYVAVLDGKTEVPAY